MVCPTCEGDGIERCTNPDHGFGRRLGCPCCGHDEKHRIMGCKCPDCNGTGIIEGAKNPTNGFNNEDDMQNQNWCMCVKLKDVARDGKSTCSICGGRDAYGLSTERPEDKKKTITNQTKE